MFCSVLLCFRCFDVCHSVPLGDDDDEAYADRNMAAVSPVPKLVTPSIKEDLCREEDDDCRDEWGKSGREINVEMKSPEMPLKRKGSTVTRLLICRSPNQLVGGA